MYLLSWDLTEDLKQSYDNLYKHASHQLYAFKHGDNDNLELNFQGYISNEPGIILDITNCFSFTQSEIEAYKTVYVDRIHCTNSIDDFITKCESSKSKMHLLLMRHAKANV